MPEPHGLSAASTSSHSLTDGVRRGIEDARDTAKRNIEYISKEIAKAERDIEQQRATIESRSEERAANEAALAQAEAMLNGN